MDTFYKLQEADIPTKINAVVMSQHNTEDIIPLVELAKNHKVSVRFIEEMPFNGEGQRENGGITWNFKKIIEHIKTRYPDLYKIPDGPNSTSYNYAIPDFKGNIGVIAAFSRTFCGTCNRIRLTAQGTLKTCLYDEGVLDIKALLRNSADDKVLEHAFLQAFQHRAKDGFEAEKNRHSNSPLSESMSTIGG